MEASTGSLRSYSCSSVWEFSFVDTADLQAVREAIRPNTKMIYAETPTNPTMILTDIAEISKIAAQHTLTLVVDNTFLSPYLQQPIPLGAHIVVHSMTKYLNGHSDATGGAVILTRPLRCRKKSTSCNVPPARALRPWTVFWSRGGIKTLAVRMRQHDANGMAVAQFLDGHPQVKRVFYPGLASHPQHAIARKQQRGFGAMISFDVDTLEAARRLLNHVKLCSLAESLGGVETLISHPATMTHASIPREVRQQTGITDGLVRLSVGIEDAEDLIADLDAALAKI